jgi:N-acetyl-alpha-D-muramate 1-phosphate uridylyltransferase
MNLFPVAILSGGIATRLRPITETIPKALVDINGEPFIAHQLRLLKAQGVAQVIICAWYRGEMIQNYVGDGAQFGLQVKYSFDGSIPLGTGGAIKQALPFLGEAFFVLYGDSYLLSDYHSIQNNFSVCKKNGLMTVFHNLDQWDTSNVEFSNGEVHVYNKKTRTLAMEHIDYGLGVFHSRVFDRYPQNQVFDLADVYTQLITDQDLAGYEVSKRFYEIGSFAGLQDLRELLKAKSD